MNTKIAEIAHNIGFMMGKNNQVITTDSREFLNRIVTAAEAFENVHDGEYIDEIDAHSDLIYNQLVSDGLIGDA